MRPQPRFLRAPHQVGRGLGGAALWLGGDSRLLPCPAQLQNSCSMLAISSSSDWSYVMANCLSGLV